MRAAKQPRVAAERSDFGQRRSDQKQRQQHMNQDHAAQNRGPSSGSIGEGSIGGVSAGANHQGFLQRREPLFVGLTYATIGTAVGAIFPAIADDQSRFKNATRQRQFWLLSDRTPSGKRKLSEPICSVNKFRCFQRISHPSLLLDIFGRCYPHHIHPHFHALKRLRDDLQSRVLQNQRFSVRGR